MAKSSNQKLKLLYVMKILFEKTDEKHSIKTKDIIEELEQYEIKTERKSVYDDISQLQGFGMDIIVNKPRVGGGYYLNTRKFELAECKLLVDAVQASKFITKKKSKDLIQKIGGMVSEYEAKELQRQVHVLNRIKTSNESIYINVDQIHKAIQKNQKITFQYFIWTVDKEMKYKKEGLRYKVSPWALTFSEDNYYLISYDETSQMMKHYRVDKMKHILIGEETRVGDIEFEKFDLPGYTNKTFGMFGGKEEVVGLQFTNDLVGVVLDRFGKDITIRKRDNEMFSIRTKIAISNQFFGWITGIGVNVTILSPQSVVEEYREYLQDMLNKYK